MGRGCEFLQRRVKTGCVTMKLFMALFLLGISSVTPVRHSLKYLYTSSTDVPNFPEFVAVYLLDGVQILHYDSNTTRAVPKQDWMSRITDDDPNFWEEETKMLKLHQQTSKANIEVVKQRLNQTGGPHVAQVMFGCEWDDETDEVNGFERHGYDGEDITSLDPKTKRWITPRPHGATPKHKWDHKKAQLTKHNQDYYTKECPAWLKKFLNYGKRSLTRKDLPSVTLLQKTPSSPVTCHATGFYPDRAELFWMKDLVVLDEDAVEGEILPNHDGTFQMSADLDVFLVEEKEWWRYTCVFRLAGVEELKLTTLEKSAILTNWHIGIGTGFAYGAVALLVVALKVGCIYARYRCLKALRQGYRRTDL